MTTTYRNVMLRFERGRDSVIGPTMGPFPFIQLTYNMLRVGPDGDDLASQIDGNSLEDWEILTGPHKGEAYSDVIIYPAPPTHIVVVGNPVDGLAFIGPFESTEAVSEFVNTDPSMDDEEWWTAPIGDPDEPE